MSFFETARKNFSSVKQEITPVFCIGFLFLFFAFSLSSVFVDRAYSATTPPSIITYQGKLLNSGTAVDATTTMEFLIYDDPTAGTLQYTAGGLIGVPSTIDVPVDQGIFSVNLGAAGTNAVTSSIFANNNALYLEVWVEGHAMTPRKRLTSAPYALNSAYLMGFSAATTSASTYIPVSDSSGNFTFLGSLTATGTATSSFTNVLVTDGITLGGVKHTSWPGGGDVSSDGANNYTATNTFYDIADFRGKIATPTLRGTINFGLGTGNDVFISHQYAYLANGDDGLRIIDITDPENPVEVGHEDTDPFNAYKVQVVGNYAYVAYDDGLAVIDVSDPTLPVKIGDTVGGFGHDLSIAGPYAYLISDTAGFESIDISDPHNIQILDSVSVGSGFSQFLDVSGHYAYITDTSDGVFIVDISDPKNLITVGNVDNGSSAQDLVVNGHYAYVANNSGTTIDILDVASSTNPQLIKHFAMDGFSAEAPLDLMVAGNYLFVAVNSADLAVLDITSSTNPARIGSSGSILPGDTKGIFVDGNYVYSAVNNGGTGALSIIDITGTKISNAQVGTLKVDNLDSTGATQFQQSVSIRGGLNVGNSGLLVNGDFSLSVATSSLAATNTIRFSHTALFETLASTTDDHAFIFNTRNSLAISTTTYLFSLRNNGVSTFSIASNGNVNTTGTYYGKDAVIGTPGAPGDLAEHVDIAIDDEVEAGDVVVVDPHSTDTYRRSNSAYSQEVSGVISSNPTIVIGNGKTEHTAVMAMVGRVPVKVSTENGPIVRGDLLITATSTGYAMRYDPTKNDGSHIAGIIGVALESFAGDKGKIMGLVRTGWVSGEYTQTFSDIRDQLSKLALAQSNFQKTDGVTVSQSNDGSIHPIESDLNLNGFSILAVRSISGLNDKWHIDEQGRFTSQVDTSDGTKTLYALQSGESQYVFLGSAALLDGKVRIDFDSSVLDIIDTSKPLSINLTLSQKAKGVYVSDRDEKGFDVEEMDGGVSDAKFDWLVFATRKDALSESDSLTVVTSTTESDSDSDSDSHISNDIATTSTVDETPTSTPAEENTDTPESTSGDHNTPAPDEVSPAEESPVSSDVSGDSPAPSDSSNESAGAEASQ